MKTYQSYNPSDVFWYDQIPQGWSITKNKFILKEQKDIVDEDWNQYQLLSLTKVGVIVRDLENSKGKFPEFFNSYKIIRKNDLIFCLYDIEETPRTIGLSGLDGMITGSYNVFQTNQVPKFIYYWYLTIDDVKGLKPFYTGMRNVVRNETFMSLKIFTPPLHEQQQIVKFLDDKTSIIDKLISTKERKIELLKEQRTSLINEVITNGLNPNVKMKDSGVEWIGEIPESWDKKKIKTISSIISKGTTPSTIGKEISDEGEFRYIKSENIVENSLSEYPQFFIDKETNELLKRSILFEGDILFVIAGASIGKTTILTKNFSNSNTNQAVSFIRLKENEKNRFVWYWLISPKIQEQMWIVAVQSAQPNLSMENLGNFYIPYPTIQEQQEIVEYLDKHTKEIDDLVQMEQKKIDLLKEYRQSLISEVITGKIKVVE